MELFQSHAPRVFEPAGACRRVQEQALVLWEHGIPWKGDGTAPAAEPTDPAPDARETEVLRMMSLGMKDDVIARVLGVSRRTVQQVISDIGALLGARTRFQIAIFAQQRGWLPEAAGREDRPPPG